MNKTKKVALSTIAAFAMAACTVATLGMAKGMTANAAEAEPVYAEQGWYMVGNGAGTLKTCSWTNYVPTFKFTPKPEDAGKKTGTFTYSGVELYAGDAFKVLYASGEWEWPNDSGWKADVTAQFSNLDNKDGYFVNGGLGNIQATEKGQGIYDFTLTVSETTTETATTTEIKLTYVRTGNITPIAKEEMYVVGTIKGLPECNWPGSIDVATKCPKMTLNEETKKWTVELELAKGDTFKVYNLASNAYFPSGIGNDCVIQEAGTYLVEYESKAPSFIVMNVETEEIVYGGPNA